MSDLHAKTGPQRKEQVGAADWGFVAFIIVITAIRYGISRREEIALTQP